MYSLIKAYQHLLLKFPIGIQAVQTGFLMGAGDLIAQVFLEKKPLKQVNSARTGQFFLVGTVFVGPSLRLWYGVMDKYFASKRKINVLKKVAADQILFAPVFLVSVISVLSVVQGNSFQETKKKISLDYFDVLINNYKLWPAVQIINFYFIPLHFQVPVVQVIAIFWNTYISWKMNR